MKLRKPRNLLQMHAWRRKAGSHTKTTKQLRGEWKRQMGV